jgi:hypothetical protein
VVVLQKALTTQLMLTIPFSRGIALTWKESQKLKKY